jgi:hypothetical protein
MPSFIRPRSDTQRIIAATSCIQKSQNTAPAKWPVTAAQIAALESAVSSFTQARDAAAVGLSTQTKTTKQAMDAWENLVRLNRHFIQVLNLAIERGTLAPSVRALYQLPVNRVEVPAMDSVPNTLGWAEKLSSGEAARVAAGGAPLAWPSIAEVEAAAAAFKAAQNAQSSAKSAYHVLQQEIARQRPAFSALLKDVRQTIEYHYRHYAPPAMRRKAHEWGLRYSDDPAEESTTPAAGG